MRILIVEDEYNLADAISSKLKKEKYVVDILTDGEEGLYHALTNIYDLIILDVMLPNKNGFSILKAIRENSIKSKVIMLTARSSLEDKLDGFEKGANDYVTKPFHLDELIARVNAQLKNKDYLEKKEVLEFDDLELDLTTSVLNCKTTIKYGESIMKLFLII